MANEHYDVYVAGPFFRPEQVESMERMEAEFEKRGWKMFRPRFDAGKLSNTSSHEEMHKTFEDDIRAIHNSDCLFANTMNLDAGTIFEVGYAYAIGIPVYGFVENLPAGAKFNVMLAGSMKGTFTSVDELVDWLDNNVIPEYDGDFE